jgi:uncharacterized paraquat-inducible protein A
MHCPECHARLILQAFWQGRYVNCTSCGAKLQRSLAAIVVSFAGGFLAYALAALLLVRAGAPMEIEIILSVAALAAGFLGIHIATLRLKPREDSSLKL